jgi:hypothetical protein
LVSFISQRPFFIWIDSIRYEGDKEVYWKFGDQYQKRTMKDGSEVEVIKNFHSLSDWAAMVNLADEKDIKIYKKYQHYYLVGYEVK